MENIIRSLEGRVIWYSKARDMLMGTLPLREKFYWPLTGLPEAEPDRLVYCAALCGAISELQSAIAMLRAENMTVSGRRRR